MEKLADIGCALDGLEDEMWLPVTGTDCAYFVSNMGRLLCRNWKGTGRDAFMKPAKDHKGYVRTMLKYTDKYRTIKVHRIVAQEWIPNPDNKPQVDHLNFVRDDNAVTNLKWATPKENTLRSYKAGRIQMTCGPRKVTEDQVREIRRKFKVEGKTRRAIALEYGIAATTVKDIVLRSWKHVH